MGRAPLGRAWIGCGLSSQRLFSVPPGVSTGSACLWMLFPTAASARMGTRGPCATRLGRLQTPVGACGACMATARPQPPRGHTVCVTPAFRASCVSKVRGPPPDMPSPGSLPTAGFSDLTFFFPNLSGPSVPPPLLVDSSAPNLLGSEPHSQTNALSLPGPACLAAPLSGLSAPSGWGLSLQKRPPG